MNQTNTRAASETRTNEGSSRWKVEDIRAESPGRPVHVTLTLQEPLAPGEQLRFGIGEIVELTPLHQPATAGG